MVLNAWMTDDSQFIDSRSFQRVNGAFSQTANAASVESVYHPTAVITLSPFVRKEGVFSQPLLRLYGELIEG